MQRSRSKSSVLPAIGVGAVVPEASDQLVPRQRSNSKSTVKSNSSQPDTPNNSRLSSLAGSRRSSVSRTLDEQINLLGKH